MNFEQVLNKGRFFHVPIWDGVDIANGIEERGPIVRHFHDTIQITLIITGAGRFHGVHSCVGTTPESLVVIPPGTTHHTIVQSAGWSFLTLHVPPVLVSLPAPSGLVHAAQSRRFLNHYRNKTLNTHFLQLVTSIVTHAPQSTATTLLSTFWAELRSAQPIADARYEKRIPSTMRQSHGYLRDHVADPISLQGLADNVGLSVSRLAHAFEHCYGLPPLAYQRQLRLLRAKHLLAQGHPIAATAAASGFADQSHLTRHFQRFTGVTPGKYQQKSKHVQDAEL